eukprot:6728019-Alexandrium_andersonii.AAC.1
MSALAGPGRRSGPLASPSGSGVRGRHIESSRRLGRHRDLGAHARRGRRHCQDQSRILNSDQGLFEFVIRA